MTKMFRVINSTAFCTLLSVLISCSDSNDVEDVVESPLPDDFTRVVFSPLSGAIPAPNDILFSRQVPADGTMHAGASSNPVVQGINELDGNSLLSPIDVVFEGSLDDSQNISATSFISSNGQVIPNPNQNIFLLPLVYPGGDALRQAGADLDGDGSNDLSEVPTFLEASEYQLAVATQNAAVLQKLADPIARAELISLDGGVNNVIRINPLKPLLPRTKYLIVVTNLSDASGMPIQPSYSYLRFREPDFSEIDDPSLLGVRNAILGWEQLANGYFGFMQSVFSAASPDLASPSSDDIIMTMTFTTGASTSFLQHVAAPETFFETSITTAYKQEAITKLLNGTYTLDGSDSGRLAGATDIAINNLINVFLTSATLPNNEPNQLYSPTLASAVQGGADYASLASSSATSAHILQRAAAEAAVFIHDSGSPELGDTAVPVSIAQEAVGTANTLLTASAGICPPNAFSFPSSRATRFFRVDDVSALNPSIELPAKVYQGQITLPVYQQLPTETSGANVLTSTWQASACLGAILDANAENPPGTTPPSSSVTYRYPFPTKQADTVVPIVVTMPNEALLTALGKPKPADGWPVIIFQHGIGADRSTSLTMASALASACIAPGGTALSGLECYATVAIDMPLHGVAPAGSTLPGLTSFSNPALDFSPNLPEGTPNEIDSAITERHYNYTANAASQPVPMDYTNNLGTSGSLFINLLNFANSRDSVRQATLDLLNVNASLDSMDVNADGEPNDLDINNVFFIGHSLGGITGIGFLATNNDAKVQASPFSQLPKVHAAKIMVSGGGLVRLLTNSESRGPLILQGLAAASDALAPGRSGLETYLNVFQGALNSVDPIGLAGTLSDANSDTGILLTEVVGGGDIPSDNVIPNGADTIWGEDNGPFNTTLENGFVLSNFPAPLAGTEPLIAAFGAVPSQNATSDGDAAVLVTRYNAGSHITPVTGGNPALDPNATPAVFAELIGQTVQFFMAKGDVNDSIVNDTSLVE